MIHGPRLKLDLNYFVSAGDLVIFMVDSDYLDSLDDLVSVLLPNRVSQLNYSASTGGSAIFLVLNGALLIRYCSVHNFI